MEKDKEREMSRTELFIRCYEKELGKSANPATKAFVDYVKGFQSDPTTDSGTSQNDVVSRAYNARHKKEKSGRVRHLGFGAKPKRVYRGSFSYSGSRESSNPSLPSWMTFGAKILEHLDKQIGLSPDLEEMRIMFASQGGCSGSAPTPTIDDNIPGNEEENDYASNDDDA